MISVDFERFRVILFCFDHFSVFSISALLVAMLLEGIILPAKARSMFLPALVCVSVCLSVCLSLCHHDI